MWSMTTVARRLLEDASRNSFNLQPVEAGFLLTFVADLDSYFGLAERAR
jgi:hypothetical protein